MTSTPNSTKPWDAGAEGVRSKKGKVGSSSKPRRRKRKQTVRVQYGASQAHRFSQDAALEILLVTNAGALDRSQGMVDQSWIKPS